MGWSLSLLKHHGTKVYFRIKSGLNPLLMAVKCSVVRLIPTLGLGFCSSAASLLKRGDVLKKARIFSSLDVVEYSKTSQDFNPLHFDTNCAQEAGFHDRIVPGMLVASLFPRIIASHFPGAIYVSQSMQFKSPVYIGEEITGEVEATDVRKIKDKYFAKFKTKCFKHGHHIVVDGQATAMLTGLAFQKTA